MSLLHSVMAIMAIKQLTMVDDDVTALYTLAQLTAVRVLADNISQQCRLCSNALVA